MMFCTNCGALNEDDAKGCVNCGESLSEGPSEEKLLYPRGLKDGSTLKKVDLLQALFDFSFNRFVSPKMMKFLYGLSVLSAGLIALLIIIGGFQAPRLFGMFLCFIGAPLVFLLMVVYSRALLEITLLIFRMAGQMSHFGERLEETSDSKDGIQWNI